MVGAILRADGHQIVGVLRIDAKIAHQSRCRAAALLEVHPEGVTQQKAGVGGVLQLLAGQVGGLAHHGQRVRDLLDGLAHAALVEAAGGLAQLLQLLAGGAGGRSQLPGGLLISVADGSQICRGLDGSCGDARQRCRHSRSARHHRALEHRRGGLGSLAQQGLLFGGVVALVAGPLLGVASLVRSVREILHVIRCVAGLLRQLLHRPLQVAHLALGLGERRPRAVELDGVLGGLIAVVAVLGLDGLQHLLHGGHLRALGLHLAGEGVMLLLVELHGRAARLVLRLEHLKLRVEHLHRLARLRQRPLKLLLAVDADASAQLRPGSCHTIPLRLSDILLLGSPCHRASGVIQCLQYRAYSARKEMPYVQATLSALSPAAPARGRLR